MSKCCFCIRCSVNISPETEVYSAVVWLPCVACPHSRGLAMAPESGEHSRAGQKLQDCDVYTRPESVNNCVREKKQNWKPKRPSENFINDITNIYFCFVLLKTTQNFQKHFVTIKTLATSWWVALINLGQNSYNPPFCALWGRALDLSQVTCQCSHASIIFTMFTHLVPSI